MTYVSTLTNIEISTLFTQVNEDKFDLDAPYQREIVWDMNKQTLFINSIMRGIIPSPLIFVSNDDKKTVIDGKQRITSIIRFKRNEIPVHLFSSNIVGNKGEETVYYDTIPLDITVNKDARIMTDKERNRFNNTNLNCVTYQDITYEDQLLIFNRIQNGVQISSADLLKASALNESSNHVLNNFYESMLDSLGKYTGNTNKEKNNHIIVVTNIMYMIKYDSLKMYGKSDRILAVQECFNDDLINKTKELITKVFPTINQYDKKLCNYMLYPYLYAVYKHNIKLNVNDYYDAVKDYKGKKDYKSIYNNLLNPAI